MNGNLELKFENGQIVIYTGTDPHVEATVFDPGSTMTTIMIFSLDYEGGKPSVFPVNNIDLIDKNEYISNKRDGKIDDIIDE